jgi:hypothetical protein
MSKAYATLTELVEAEGLTREQLVGEYSDMYKERNGIRPRWNYGMSIPELIAEMESMVVQDREIEEQRVQDEIDHTNAVATAMTRTEFTIGDVFNLTF